jgi:hypothetical protein
MILPHSEGAEGFALKRTSRQLRKMAHKVHGIDMLDMAEEIDLAVYVREQMFPGVELYSAEQVAAADTAIAAYTPEEREAALRAAHAQQDEGRVG